MSKNIISTHIPAKELARFQEALRYWTMSNEEICREIVECLKSNSYLDKEHNSESVPISFIGRALDNMEILTEDDAELVQLDSKNWKMYMDQICKMHIDNGCCDCPMSLSYINNRFTNCTDLKKNFPEKAKEIVMKYVHEHHNEIKSDCDSFVRDVIANTVKQFTEEYLSNRKHQTDREEQKDANQIRWKFADKLKSKLYFCDNIEKEYGITVEQGQTMFRLIDSVLEEMKGQN